MTAAEFAALLEGRATGRGRWQARCPAHRDHLPSLSITEGQDGRILVRCFAGCSLDAILAAMNLRCCDLFQGPPPSSEQLRGTAAAQMRAEAEARARRITHGKLCDRIHKLEQASDALGKKLALTPCSPDLAWQSNHKSGCTHHFL